MNIVGILGLLFLGIILWLVIMFFMGKLMGRTWSQSSVEDKGLNVVGSMSLVVTLVIFAFILELLHFHQLRLWIGAGSGMLVGALSLGLWKLWCP